MADSAGEKGQRKAVRIISPARLARLLDRSQRTVREYCKNGIIPEAFRTRGGHWRIRWPLSVITRYELEKRQPDWPFKGMKGDFGGDWNPDIAESLMLSLICEVDVGDPLLVEADVGDPVLVLHLAELADHQDNYPMSGTEKESAARRIQDEINQRVETGKPFWDMLLTGWVYQYSRKNKDRPTVEKIADFMGISRDTFYRRYTTKKLNAAYFTATGKFKQELPDLRGLDSVQRANRNAKKSGFASLHHDPFAGD